MITVKEFLHMCQTDESELEKIVDEMPEQDAKAYLLAFMKAIHKYNQRILDALNLD